MLTARQPAGSQQAASRQPAPTLRMSMICWAAASSPAGPSARTCMVAAAEAAQAQRVPQPCAAGSRMMATAGWPGWPGLRAAARKQGQVRAQAAHQVVAQLRDQLPPALRKHVGRAEVQPPRLLVPLLLVPRAQHLRRTARLLRQCAPAGSSRALQPSPAQPSPAQPSPAQPSTHARQLCTRAVAGQAQQRQAWPPASQPGQVSGAPADSSPPGGPPHLAQLLQGRGQGLPDEGRDQLGPAGGAAVQAVAV
jgi:hypothetical protein